MNRTKTRQVAVELTGPKPCGPSDDRVREFFSTPHTFKYNRTTTTIYPNNVTPSSKQTYLCLPAL